MVNANKKALITTSNHYEQYIPVVQHNIDIPRSPVIVDIRMPLARFTGK